MEKGQRFRTQAELEAVYQRANLLVHKKSVPTSLDPNMLEVMMWALN